MIHLAILTQTVYRVSDGRTERQNGHNIQVAQKNCTIYRAIVMLRGKNSLINDSFFSNRVVDVGTARGGPDS